VGPNSATSLDEAVLGWVADVLAQNPVTVLRGLSDGGSPWLLRCGDREAVLRVGQPSDAAGFATETAALRLAVGAGVPVPRLLGHDAGTAAGVPLLLAEWLPGSSQVPRSRNDGRLQALGATAARLHAVPAEPSSLLPTRERPIALVDFAAMRQELPPGSLLAEADAAIAETEPAGAPSVFVHGDLWHGNTLWQDAALTGIVDWDCAGCGAPGVDLGSLRCDAALSYGTRAPAEVLRGWEESAGHPAADVAYWDAVAALATPPDMEVFQAAFSAQGRPDLDRATLRLRRDTFLRQALERLP
jgi:aminoglycoside phosphotransferase (APT) family kinase protein